MLKRYLEDLVAQVGADEKLRVVLLLPHKHWKRSEIRDHRPQGPAPARAEEFGTDHIPALSPKSLWYRHTQYGLRRVDLTLAEDTSRLGLR